MTISQFLNGVIYAGTVAGALSGIGVFFHFAVVRPLRAFLRREIVVNLVEIRDAVSGTAEGVADVAARLEEHISNGGHAHE